jgi:hypothetical protein
MSSEATHSSLEENLFIGHVAMQANMALIGLGQVPNPATGKAEPNLATAKVFIDILEMLAAKTKGNLTPDENTYLQEALTNLRMVFVAQSQSGPK